MLLLSVGLLGGSVRYALDEVRAVAKGAWSVRRLRAVYRGPAIRVRRASDGREQDVGFDGSGNLDVPALSRFCGASEGSVSIWYDQSGLGQDLSQAAPGNQPGVFAAGEVRKLGNAAAKPGFAFTAAAHNFLTNTQFSLGGASFAACSVASRTANIPIDGRLVSFTAAGSTVDYNSNQSVIMSLYDSGQIRGHRNGVWTSSASVGTAPFQVSSVWNGVNHKLTLNGVAAPTVASSGSAASVGTLSVGDNGAAINQYDLWDGMMSEHIVFSGVFSSADQMRVQVDQKTYFGAP